MGLITSGQVWKQRRGKIRVQIVWFCKAGHCNRDDDRSKAYRLLNHVHVRGWHEVTLKATNHSIIRVSDLSRDWDLIL